MNKPIKDWGSGIPQYCDSDVLSGLELHEFCTNVVAQSMQDDGYTIEGIIVQNTPTQVIANKNGRKYFVIVAGGVYPREGKISCDLKMRFSSFCKKQGIIPMFASVGLMSSDPERAEAGLALKYDGYLIKYVGNEDLSQLSIPEKSSEDFKSYCVEKIIESYRTGTFEKIYDFFADDIQFHSQWVLNPLVGRDAVIDYFDGKGKTIQKSNTQISGSVVVITNNYTKNGNVVLMAEDGQVCALLSQKINGQTNWIFVSPKFNKEGQLIQIALNDPALFTFEDYYAFE